MLFPQRLYGMQAAVGRVATKWEWRWSIKRANNLSFPSASSETQAEIPIFPCATSVESDWVIPDALPLSSQSAHGDEADSRLHYPPPPPTAAILPPTPPSHHISKQMTAYQQHHTKKEDMYTKQTIGVCGDRIIVDGDSDMGVGGLLKRKQLSLIVQRVLLMSP